MSKLPKTVGGSFGGGVIVLRWSGQTNNFEAGRGCHPVGRGRRAGGVLLGCYVSSWGCDGHRICGAVRGCHKGVIVRGNRRAVEHRPGGVIVRELWGFQGD